MTFTEEELGLGAPQHSQQQRAQPASTAGAPPPAGLHPPSMQQRHQVLPPGPNPLLGAPPLLQHSPPPPLQLPLSRYPQAAPTTQQRGAAPLQQSQQVPAPQSATRVTGYGPDGLMPKGEAVAAFKGLLSDRGVHAFSRYERELPKLQSDPRFKVGACCCAAHAAGVPALP